VTWTSGAGVHAAPGLDRLVAPTGIRGFGIRPNAFSLFDRWPAFPAVMGRVENPGAAPSRVGAGKPNAAGDGCFREHRPTSRSGTKEEQFGATWWSRQRPGWRVRATAEHRPVLPSAPTWPLGRRPQKLEAATQADRRLLTRPGFRVGHARFSSGRVGATGVLQAYGLYIPTPLQPKPARNSGAVVFSTFRGVGGKGKGRAHIFAAAGSWPPECKGNGRRRRRIPFAGRGTTRWRRGQPRPPGTSVW